MDINNYGAIDDIKEINIADKCDQLQQTRLVRVHNYAHLELA